MVANTKIISGEQFLSKWPVEGQLNKKGWRPLI